MPTEGVKFLGAYIKLRKFAVKSKRREKKFDTPSLILNQNKRLGEKNGCRNVKNSARFAGNSGKNDEIRTQIA